MSLFSLIKKSGEDLDANSLAKIREAVAPQVDEKILEVRAEINQQIGKLASKQDEYDQKFDELTAALNKISGGS